jgi:hypothetical protein
VTATTLDDNGEGEADGDVVATRAIANAAVTATVTETRER